MSTTMGRYRYWGDQKPDTSRPLLTLTRPREAVAAITRGGSEDQPTVTATLRIYGPIDSWGGWWGVSAKEVAQALDMLGDAERVIVRVNSPGGESSEGRAIVNLLRAHSAEIVTVVDGAAYSAASYIAACGNDSVMSPGTTLMIHDTSTFMYGNEAAFRKTADVLGTLSDSGAELYAEIAGGTAEQWRELQRAETWYTAATAVESGLMKRVATVPDAGQAETAGDEPAAVDPDDVEERARAGYDLSLFEKAPSAGSSNPKPPSASAVGSSEKKGAAVVDLTDEQIKSLREQVGFPEDADATTIVSAIHEALSETADPTPSSAKVPEGMQLVEASVLAELQAGVTAGREAREQQRVETRDRLIQDAITAGKTTPARREHWAKSYDADPEGTKSMLDALAAGLAVPTQELGHGGEPDTTEADSLYAAVFGDQKIGA